MGEIHDTLEAEGRLVAIRNGWDRREVEAATSYMADEDSGIGFLYSGWCQAALPHRQWPDGKTWQVESEHIALLVNPGAKRGANGAIQLGVPYGSRARLIMLYLQTEALRTGCREVELGGCMKEWLSKMDVPIGGRSYTMIRDQAERIARCSLTFEMKGASWAGIENQAIVEKAEFFVDPREAAQGALFPETANLSEAFFKLLHKHPVPIEESAIRAINNNSLALDIYAWLAYRLHVLKGPTPIGWRALKPQFGNGFNRLDHFRTTFLTNLKLAMAVYRDAKVDVEDAGVVLHHSKPPVLPRAFPVKSNATPRMIAVGKSPT